MSTSDTSSIDADILSRVIHPDDGDLPPELAQAVLKLDFCADDRYLMEQLAQKAREGELTEQEQAQLDSFVRVGHFISIMKSKARVSLERHSDT